MPYSDYGRTLRLGRLSDSSLAASILGEIFHGFPQSHQQIGGIQCPGHHISNLCSEEVHAEGLNRLNL